ncbi:MAG TPA: hypothetical protein VHT75_10675 [Acidimicrobiales bacterium]|jgi:hypothetical protein|nr:hypothetical protein [Acidimicrobiales bacterium]
MRGGKGRDDMVSGANPTGSDAPTQQGVSSPDPKPSNPGNTQGGGSN